MYWYAGKGLSEWTKEEQNKEGFSSVKGAKKYKACITDMIQPSVKIEHEQWHVANGKVQEMQKHLGLYTAMLASITKLQVDIKTIGDKDPNVQVEAESREAALQVVGVEINKNEVTSLQLISVFSGLEKSDNQGIQENS